MIKIKDFKGDWVYVKDENSLKDTFNQNTKCFQLLKDVFANDILESEDNDYLLVLSSAQVKVLSHEDYQNKNFDNENFMMSLQEFIRYNHYKVIGNKFDFV